MRSRDHMKPMSYDDFTSFDVFTSLYTLSDFKGCVPKPILKDKPKGPTITGESITIKFMNWTETLTLSDGVLYLDAVWKDRASVIIKLLICALTYNIEIERVGVNTKSGSDFDSLVWPVDKREKFMESVRAKWWTWTRTVPSKPLFAKIMGFNLGTHVPFRKTLEASLKDRPNDRPYQVFMHSKDEPTPYTIFIHSPYTINLDKPESVPQLEEQLEIADSIGAKGVVVHCAKGESADNMYANLKKIDMSEYKTDLLIETSSGQGSEVLSNPADLNSFVDRINDPKIRVCLDTCHVFAAGYDPVQAMATLRGKIALVHYNNSKRKFGSRVDRHQDIVGHIDGVTMYKVAYICTKLGIPMVIE